MPMFKKLKVTRIEDEDPSSFSSESNRIHLSDGKSPDEHWIVKDASPVILISNEKYGLAPQCYQLSDQLYGVGVNERFFLVERGEIRTDSKLPCRFYELIHVQEPYMVIHHETGFICLTFDGDAHWDKGGDLIQDWRIEGDRLLFETWGGKKMSVRLPR